MSVLSFCILCLLLVAGKFLRLRFRFLQWLYLPSSVIGGLFGLLLIQGFFLFASFGDAAVVDGSKNAISSLTTGWGALPGFLINIVFAVTFLGVVLPKMSTIWQKAGPQLAYGQIVAWGQYVVGLGLVVFLLGPIFKVADLFGVVIPVGFEGGHGTAGGLKDVFANQMDWADGGDIALASATAGIISAIIVGMALVNWAVRRGFLKHVQPFASMNAADAAGVYEPGKRPSAGFQTVKSDSVESLALHMGFIGVAVFIGYIIRELLRLAEGTLPERFNLGVMSGFPLFPLCMIGGLLVQMALKRMKRDGLIDHGLMQRLGGMALDFLVVAAISMIRLETISRAWLPFVVIVSGGILWNVFCVMWLARRMLPGAWFERSIAEMGQSMGVTATGLLLLRVADPDAKTEASEAFAYKQLMHEPFMGGGLWTSTAVYLVWHIGGAWVLLISVSAIVIWLIVWRLFLKKMMHSGTE